jgi:hypothetical protein
MSEKKRQRSEYSRDDDLNKASKVIISDVSVMEVSPDHKDAILDNLNDIFHLLGSQDQFPTFSVNKSGDSYYINIVTTNDDLEIFKEIDKCVDNCGFKIKGKDATHIKIIIRIPFEQCT